MQLDNCVYAPFVFVSLYENIQHIHELIQHFTNDTVISQSSGRETVYVLTRRSSMLLGPRFSLVAVKALSISSAKANAVISRG